VVRSILQGVLEEAGYVVLASGNLAVAVDMLSHSKVELLITRPYVDNMTGHKAANYLQEKNPHMRILIVAGLMDDDRLEYRAQIARFEVFPEPFTSAQFLAKVEQVLRKPRA
jgi:DNA-binding NtrC family response regulator